MTASKNMIRGTLLASVYIVTTLIIPFMTFSWIRNLGTVGGSDVAISMSDERYYIIIFWITAFGLLISGVAFFTYSSPSQSIRRGVLALIQIILNCLYLWSYKFSGATEVILNLSAGGQEGEIG